jgi:hypothetical protein
LNFVSFKELEADFKSHVPGLDLPTLLSELSSTRPLYTITPSKELRQQYCVAIMYLLRFDLVIQLHMYLVLLPIPKEVSPTSTSDDQLGSSPTDDWLKRFASDKAPREVADLFQRYAGKGLGKLGMQLDAFLESGEEKDGFKEHSNFLRFVRRSPANFSLQAGSLSQWSASHG